MGINYNPQISLNGLVLYLDAANRKSYPGSGTTWTDLSGLGNTGTLVNGVGYTGSNGGSLSFDGSNDFVSCGNILNFTTENFTFNMFFYYTSTTTSNPNPGQGPVIVYKGQYNANGYYLQLSQTNPSGAAFVTNQAGANQYTSSNSLLVVGAWNCISVVRNGPLVNIYINGVDATAGSSGPHINPASSTNNFQLAAYANSIYSNLRISSFQAYNRALSASEIQQNFNALRSRFGI